MVNPHDTEFAMKLAMLGRALGQNGGSLRTAMEALRPAPPSAAAEDRDGDTTSGATRRPSASHKVPKRVKAHFDNNGVEYTVRNDSLVFTLQNVVCLCVQINKVVVFQANRVGRIRTDAKGEVAVLLNDAHRKYLMGTWSVDDDGDVNFAVDVFKEKGGPSDTAIDRCLSVLANSIKEVRPMLTKYLASDSDEEHIAAETFRYPCGVRAAAPRWFNVSDEACMAFGFRHGDRVRDPVDGQTATVIGVREVGDGTRSLWFHVDGMVGAGMYTPEVLARLKKIGHQEVEPAP